MCSRENCRHAEVGDMIVQLCPETDEKWIGIVIGNIHKKYSHERVSIVWNKENPNYRDQYGYSKTNIHNLRSKFKIYKGKG